MLDQSQKRWSAFPGRGGGKKRYVSRIVIRVISSLYFNRALVRELRATRVYLGLNAVQSVQNSLQPGVGSTHLQETSTDVVLIESCGPLQKGWSKLKPNLAFQAKELPTPVPHR